jgi:hypothetical protein
MLPITLEQTPISHADEVRLAKGFIMYKMRHLGYMSGDHTSIDNLPKSSPPELRPYIDEAIRQLFQERHLSKKTTEYGVEVTMIKSKTAFDYANLYATRYDLEVQEYGTSSRPEKAPPLPSEVLRALKFKKKK